MNKVNSLEIKNFLKSISEYIRDNGIQNKVENVSSIDNNKKDTLSWVNDNEIMVDDVVCNVLIVPSFFNFNKIKKKEISVFTVKNPKLSFFKTLEKFFMHDKFTDTVSNKGFTHPSFTTYQVSNKSFIHPSAEIQKNVIIEDGVIIEKNCKIKKNTIIGANSYISNTEISANCIIGPNCTIGKDGAGFVFDNTTNSYFKIPHLGTVKIGKDCEIQSNTFISRGTLDSTIIKSGTKIGPSTCIAHNVIIGNNCLLTGGNTIGGSSRLGTNVFMGLGSVISNKIKLGNHVFLSAGSVVVNDLKNKSKVSGNFAINHNKFLYNLYKQLK